MCWKPPEAEGKPTPLAQRAETEASPFDPGFSHKGTTPSQGTGAPRPYGLTRPHCLSISCYA